jgi:hypothetical protein
MKTLAIEQSSPEVNRSLFLPDIKNQTEDISLSGDSRSIREDRRRIIGIGEKIQRVKSHVINQEKDVLAAQQDLTASQREEKGELKRKTQ